MSKKKLKVNQIDMDGAQTKQLLLIVSVVTKKGGEVHLKQE